MSVQRTEGTAAEQARDDTSEGVRGANVDVKDRTTKAGLP